ncbi:Sec-independent protein translocase protein TatB [Arenibaculum sp.]|jgi:sec-independent protein translocase protein TatB|uniref:Sec-independent protein translocase protein TatB n=1 Tax=Arenibaculum sp. TaxID=2865862 RepID=UPI002E124084|nr:Sec-independent protein translocase protein TatB [Arenibaculum sp.]
MLDIGWTELAVIIVVALIVIGPKDLPMVLKTVGGWVRKARMLTREFQSSIDDMVREAELDEVRKQALELKQLNVAKQIEKTIDPTGSLRNAFDPEDTGSKDTGSKDTAKANEAAAPATAAAQAVPAPAPAPAPAPPADAKAEAPETAGQKQA